MNPTSLSFPEQQLSPLWPGLAQAISSLRLGFLGKSCLFYCVIFLPTGPVPDLFQKYLAVSFSSPSRLLPLCSGAAGGVMHCCWVTFADTLLTGTQPRFPEVKLPASLCVSVFVDVLFLIFLWLSCDVPAVQITSPSP